MSDERWIVVRNWQRFQHYGDRAPLWIKVYAELERRDEWTSLTLEERGLLVSVWLAYARRDGQLRVSDVSRYVLARVRRRALDSLQAAGFIEFSASKPLAIRYLARARAREELEKEKEKEPSPTPSASGRGVEKIEQEKPHARRRLSAKELRRYTGCRMTRGSHGFGYVRDVLGVDKPPADWPWPKPERDDVIAALVERSGPHPDDEAGDGDEREHEERVGEHGRGIDSASTAPALDVHADDDTPRRTLPHVELRSMP